MIDVDRSTRTFTVMLIAYTQERVVMTGKSVGDSVNLEVDQMAKYGIPKPFRLTRCVLVEKTILGLLESPSGTNGQPAFSAMEAMVTRIVDDRLSKIGKK